MEIKDEKKGSVWEDYKKSLRNIDLQRAHETVNILKAKKVIRALRKRRQRNKTKTAEQKAAEKAEKQRKLKPLHDAMTLKTQIGSALGSATGIQSMVEKGLNGWQWARRSELHDNLVQASA